MWSLQNHVVYFCVAVIFPSSVCGGLNSFGRASPGCTNAACPYSLDNTLLFFPHDTDCDRYCMCDWYSVAHDMACPGGLHWNSAINVCDWPYNVECKSFEAKTTNNIIETTTIITTTIPGVTTDFSTITTTTTTKASATSENTTMDPIEISTTLNSTVITTTPAPSSTIDLGTTIKLSATSSTSRPTTTSTADYVMSSSTEVSNSDVEYNPISHTHVRLVWPLRPWIGKL